ncbi:acetyltransferase [Jejuia pallidilutea]|uniref:Acetyltransferase n=1 Tax=Jejuia pallidilutea TaxID=504487 RepID=A0A090VXW5_9FLAO|nr:acetyltransferase [Jejuia pallidilutea]
MIEYDGVKFYNPEICPFGAFTDASKTEEALTAYSKLTDNFFLVSENGIPTVNTDTVALNRKIEGCQMVLNQLIEQEITETIVPLTSFHRDEIYNLIWLVMLGTTRKELLKWATISAFLKIIN